MKLGLDGRHLSRIGELLTLRWHPVPGARYRVLVRDTVSGELVVKARTDKPHLELPMAALDRGRRYTWRPQMRRRGWRKPWKRWRDLLPELRLPLPPPEGAALTALDLPADGAPAHRVVVRDDTIDEFVIKDGVVGERYLVNWAELDPSHRHRFKIQRWRDGRWVSDAPYGWLYPPHGLLQVTGMIDSPVGGRNKPVRMNPLYIHGWALCRDGAAVARVEIMINGISLGLARLGQPRPEISAHYSHPDAPICGFHHRLAGSQLPNGANAKAEVTIGAVVHATDGSRFVLDPVTTRLRAPEQRSRDPARSRTASRRPGGIGGKRSRSKTTPQLLIFVHRLDLGGAHIYLAELLDRLVRERQFSCTLASPVDGPMRERFEGSGVSIHLTSCDFTCAESYERGLIELGEWAASGEFDLVLGNMLDAAPAIDLAARLGIPGVLVVHESVDFPIWTPDLHWGSADRYVRNRIRDALGEAAAVVFTAEATRRQYISYGRPERFLTMPYGIPLDKIDAQRRRFDRMTTRRELGIPDNAMVILCLGTIQPRKSQACLAQAFSRLADGHPDATLFLVGDRADDYSAALRAYVERADLSQRVMILPVVAPSDAYRWHEVADLLVSSSDNESLPFVVLEAMAFETPVLATSVFGVPEVIEDGRSGYLCAPRDLEDLAGALDRVLSAPADERRAVALAGVGAVRERHDLGRYVDTFGDLLRMLIEDRGASPRRSLGFEPTY
jgi:D-inositol-3-phosphate glycosyltransferase